MMKFYTHNLFRRGLFDKLTVCEMPLSIPCNANKTRLDCVLKDCCFFMDACYKKTIPGYIIAIYTLIIMVTLLFWGVLGFWFYKYKIKKRKFVDMTEGGESPADKDTTGISPEQQAHENTSHVEDETVVARSESTLVEDKAQDKEQNDVKAEGENTGETAAVEAGNTSDTENEQEDVKATTVSKQVRIQALCKTFCRIIMLVNRWITEQVKGLMKKLRLSTFHK
ncbi:testis-expressed protein 29 [Engystomops pustulosus]|uniref:testis-expressed protein 29 n=1 Tax=Engystomops pustulosus TaxID=76066 RepID=UPI003AFAA607